MYIETSHLVNHAFVSIRLEFKNALVKSLTESSFKKKKVSICSAIAFVIPMQ